MLSVDRILLSVYLSLRDPEVCLGFFHKGQCIFCMCSGVRVHTINDTVYNNWYRVSGSHSDRKYGSDSSSLILFLLLGLGSFYFNSVQGFPNNNNIFTNSKLDSFICTKFSDLFRDQPKNIFVEGNRAARSIRLFTTKT